MSGFKKSNLKKFETLDEKYAVSEKTTKTWIIKIEHKIMYWNDSLITELNKKLGKNNQKNKRTLGFVIFIIIPCLYKFFELFGFGLLWFWTKTK